jgi:hypothetical protein
MSKLPTGTSTKGKHTSTLTRNKHHITSLYLWIWGYYSKTCIQKSHHDDLYKTLHSPNTSPDTEITWEHSLKRKRIKT